MTDQMIPTLAMVRDPRLRRLFAHIGRAIHEAYTTGDFVSDRTLEALHDDLMDLAPEYLPPEFGPDEDGSLMDEWQQVVEAAEGCDAGSDAHQDPGQPDSA